MKIFYFVILLCLVACKNEKHKNVNQFKTNKDSILWLKKFINEVDSINYHKIDSIGWYYTMGNVKRLKLDTVSYDIRVSPSCFYPYNFNFVNISIVNDTISGLVVETSMNKKLKGKKIFRKYQKGTTEINKFYIYEPKQIAFYNPTIAKTLSQNLDKWMVKGTGLDGGHFMIKQTNAQNQVFYYDLFWHIFEDEEVKYFYNTLCTELVGRTFE